MDNYSYTSIMLKDLRCAVEARNEKYIYRWTSALNTFDSISACVDQMVMENALMLRLELVRWVNENKEASEDAFGDQGELDYVKNLEEKERCEYIDTLVGAVTAGGRSAHTEEEWKAFLINHFVRLNESQKYSTKGSIGLLELCLALGMNVNRTRHLLIRVLGDGDLNFKDVKDIVWAYGLQAHISYDEVCDLITWAEDEMATGVKKHKVPLTEKMEEADRRYDMTRRIKEKFDGDDDPFAEMGEFNSREEFEEWLKPMLPDLKSANGGSRTATLVYRWLMNYWYELVQKKEKGYKCPDLEDELYTAVLTAPVNFQGNETDIIKKVLPEEEKDVEERELLYGTVTVVQGSASVDMPAEQYARSHYKYLLELMTGDRPVQKRDLLLLVFFICSEAWDKTWSAKDRWEVFYNVVRKHVLRSALMTDFYLPAPAERGISLAICNKDPQYAYYLLQTILAVDPILEAEAEKKLGTNDGKRAYEKKPEKKKAKDARDWDRENWLTPIAEQTWQEWDYCNFDKTVAEFVKEQFRKTGAKSIQFAVDLDGLKLQGSDPEIRLDYPSTLKELMEAPVKFELKCAGEGCKEVLAKSDKRLFDAKKGEISRGKGKKQGRKGTVYCLKCLAKRLPESLDCSEDSLRKESQALEQTNAGQGLTMRAQVRYLMAAKLKIAVLSHFEKEKITCTINTKNGFLMTFFDGRKDKSHIILRELGK